MKKSRKEFLRDRALLAVVSGIGISPLKWTGTSATNYKDADTIWIKLKYSSVMTPGNGYGVVGLGGLIRSIKFLLTPVKGKK